MRSASASTASAPRPTSWRRWRAIRAAEIFAFTRPGDAQAQAFARELGAVWAGGSDETPPEALDAAIIFAPVGALVPAALTAVRKGGVVVCGGIHMSDIPSFPYDLLWDERVVRSVANLTREDAHEFLALAPKVPVKTTVVPMQLTAANEALKPPAPGRADRRRRAHPLIAGLALRLWLADLDVDALVLADRAGEAGHVDPHHGLVGDADRNRDKRARPRRPRPRRAARRGANYCCCDPDLFAISPSIVDFHRPINVMPAGRVPAKGVHSA